jgi:hypothetical protein
MPRLLNSRRQARRSRQVAIEITVACFPAANSSRMAPWRPRAFHRPQSFSSARFLRAVRRGAILVVAEGQCPHPGASYGSRVGSHDAADNWAIREYVEVLIVPLPDGRLAHARLSIQRPAHSSSRLSSRWNPAGSRGGLSALETLQDGHGIPAPPHPQALSPLHGRSSCVSQTQ